MIGFVRILITILIASTITSLVTKSMIEAHSAPMTPNAHVGNHTSTTLVGGMLVSLKDITKTSCIYYGIGNLPDIERPKQGDTCEASIRVYEVETPADTQ